MLKSFGSLAPDAVRLSRSFLDPLSLFSATKNVQSVEISNQPRRSSVETTDFANARARRAQCELVFARISPCALGCQGSLPSHWLPSLLLNSHEPQPQANGNPLFGAMQQCIHRAVLEAKTPLFDPVDPESPVCAVLLTWLSAVQIWMLSRHCYMSPRFKYAETLSCVPNTSGQVSAVSVDVYGEDGVAHPFLCVTLDFRPRKADIREDFLVFCAKPGFQGSAQLLLLAHNDQKGIFGVSSGLFRQEAMNAVQHAISHRAAAMSCQVFSDTLFAVAAGCQPLRHDFEGCLTPGDPNLLLMLRPFFTPDSISTQFISNVNSCVAAWMAGDKTAAIAPAWPHRS